MIPIKGYIVTFVNDAEGRGGREFGPVGGSGKPLEIVAKESVRGRAGMHERIGHDSRSVTNRVANLKTRAGI